MSIPRVPGYSDDIPTSLADSWVRPPGDYPEELWPQHILRQIVQDPTDWISVDEYHDVDGQTCGRSAVLVKPEDVDTALETQSWIGKSLGSSNMWMDGLDPNGFEDGLSCKERGIRIEFLAQARHQHSLRSRVFEVALPFLWYWDAIMDGPT